jgi:hypothetical protein
MPIGLGAEKDFRNGKHGKRAHGERMARNLKGLWNSRPLARAGAILGGNMNFLTAEEIAKILRTSVWFVYEHRKLFGGIKIGKVVRFDKEIFESKIKEVMSNDSLPASGEMAVRLLEERSTSEGERISNEVRSKGRRSRSSQTSKKDEFGLYKLMREQVKGS